MAKFTPYEALQMIRTARKLQGADLRGADLSDAELSGANLADANLRQAELSGARLDTAILDGVLLYQASYNSETIWPAGFNWARAITRSYLWVPPATDVYGDDG